MKNPVWTWFVVRGSWKRENVIDKINEIKKN
jgi:hypothetical protein